MDDLVRQYLLSKLGSSPDNLQALDAARRGTQETGNLSNIGRAFQTISTAIGTPGQKVDNSFYDNMDKQAQFDEKAMLEQSTLINNYLNQKYGHEQKNNELERKQNDDAFDKDYKNRSLDIRSKELQEMRSERHSRDQERREERQQRDAKLSDRQVEEVSDFDKSIAAMEDVLGKAKPEFIGLLDGRTPNILTGADEAAFRASVGRVADAYRKLITGAGAGLPELRRLESRLPQPTDPSFDNFVAKANDFLQEVKRNKGVVLGNLAKRGKDTSAFESSAVASRKVRVSNGQETFEIDTNDLPDAERDGYKRVN